MTDPALLEPVLLIEHEHLKARVRLTEGLLYQLLRVLACDTADRETIRACAQEIIVAVNLPGIQGDADTILRDAAADEGARKIRELVSRARGDRTVRGAAPTEEPKDPADGSEPA